MPVPVLTLCSSLWQVALCPLLQVRALLEPMIMGRRGAACGGHSGPWLGCVWGRRFVQCPQLVFLRVQDARTITCTRVRWLFLCSHRCAKFGGVQAVEYPWFPQVYGKPESEDEWLGAQQPAHLAVPGRGGTPGHESYSAKVRARQLGGGWVWVGTSTTCVLGEAVADLLIFTLPNCVKSLWSIKSNEHRHKMERFSLEQEFVLSHGKRKRKIKPFSISIHFWEQPYKTRKIWQYMKSFILISNWAYWKKLPISNAVWLPAVTVICFSYSCISLKSVFAVQSWLFKKHDFTLNKPS